MFWIELILKSWCSYLYSICSSFSEPTLFFSLKILWLGFTEVALQSSSEPVTQQCIALDGSLLQFPENHGHFRMHDSWNWHYVAAILVRFDSCFVILPHLVVSWFLPDVTDMQFWREHYKRLVYFQAPVQL